MTTTLAGIWHDHVLQPACLLNPRKIAATITATLDDGIRAASYDGPNVTTSGRSDSHPERMVLSPTRDHGSYSDLNKLADLDKAFIHAVTELLLRARSTNGYTPSTWQEATTDANLLHELGHITDLERLDRKHTTRWVHAAGDAVHDVGLIHDRHCPHVPSLHDRLMVESVCLSHARIGAYDKPRHGSMHVCKLCRDLIDATGKNPSLVHNDSETWPSTDVLRAHADMERTGKRQHYLRVRSDWLGTFATRRGA